MPFCLRKINAMILGFPLIPVNSREFCWFCNSILGIIFVMIKPFRIHHLTQAIEEFSNQSLPLDLFLNQYYRANKALGSKDRLFLSETLYAVIRWKGLLDASGKDDQTWE